MPESSEAPMLTPAAALRELHDWHIPISRSALYRAILDHQVAAIRVAGRWRITREELLAFRSRCEAGERF